jgi:hypothetical protein
MCLIKYHAIRYMEEQMNSSIHSTATLTFQRGVMSAARHSENTPCRGVTNTARHAVRSHSFDNISTTYRANIIGLLFAYC